MTFTYDSADYTLPDGLEDITVDKYAGWTTTYGADLDAAFKLASAITDQEERSLQLSILYIDRMTKALSYYSARAISPFDSIPLSDVQQHIDIRQVLSYVGATELPIALEERGMVIADSYLFDSDVYFLNAPQASDLTDYDSFLLLLDLGKKVLLLKNGDFSVISILLAAYFRLAGETAPDSDDVVVGSTREVLMRTVPMSIALPFAYYVTAAMDAFLGVLETYAAS